MEFQMSSVFTMAGVENLAKMKQLKYVYIKVDDDEDNEAETSIGDAKLLVQIAGRVPNLVKVDFDFNKRKSWEFVQLYGQLYPDKNLLICQLA
jgi:hypothetical protein